MAGYKIQLKDKNGNLQYPVSTTNVVVDADGVSVADLLDRKQPTLVSGVNIKTINGKTLLGEGDLVIEGGTADLSGYATTEYVDAKVGESYPVHLPINGIALTDEQIAINKEAYDAFQRATQEEGLPLFYMADMNASYYLMVAQGSDENGVLDHLYLFRDIYTYSTDAEIWEMTIEGELQPDGSITNFEMHDRGTYTKTYLDNRFSQISGGGSDSSNVVSFYIPLMDDSREVVTYEDCINEITTRFADSISQEVIDAITSHFQSMIDHNVASFAELEERLRNGEKPLIVMRGFTYWMFVLTLYLWAVAEGGGMDMTDEELIAELDLLANIYEVIYPESYMMDFNEDSGAALEVNVESIGVSIGANGNWEKQSETDVRKTATLYYEGAARLTAKECETNLKSKGYRLNNCDFQVNRYEGGGWSDDEDILIIGKSTKTVTDFVDLDGTVSTRDVVAFRYLDDLTMVELQVSTHDGYCRKVVLGQLQLA